MNNYLSTLYLSIYRQFCNNNYRPKVILFLWLSLIKWLENADDDRGNDNVRLE